MTPASVPSRPEPQTRHPVFVHIGEAKTGTTYLQNLFDENRDELRAAGVLYPECGSSGHVLATLDLRRTTFKGTPDPKIAGSWCRIVSEIRRWNGPSLISCELLAPAARRHIRRLLESLAFAEVHAVFTARDRARVLPAAWQERVKNRGQEPFAEWLAAIHDPGTAPTSPGRLFWGLHDVEAILARWSEDIPPERVHIVTLPPSGADPTLLWKRFAQVLDVDPGRFREPTSGVNTSLGAAEVSVVRQVNIAIGGDDFSWPQYDRLMKWYLSPQLSLRRGIPIELPEAEYDWAVAQSHQVAKAIADAGYDVVGDLSELLPTRRPTGMDPDRVTGELEAEVGIEGIASLIHLLAQREPKEEAPQTPPPVRRRRALKRRLIKLSERHMVLHQIRRGYWILVNTARRVRAAGRRRTP